MGLLLPMQTSMRLVVDRRQREAAGWRDPTSCRNAMGWGVLKSLTVHCDSISNDANCYRGGCQVSRRQWSGGGFLSPPLVELFASVLKGRQG